MLGTVAQVIALTTYGNAILQDAHSISGPAFYPLNSTFQFCEYVRFVDVAGSEDSRQEKAWTADPIAWFDRLGKEKVYALRLQHSSQGGKTVGSHHVPDRMLAGFVGGGGRWLVEAIGPGGSDYWEARWEVGERGRTDRKIWRVTYGRIARGQVTQASDPEDLENLKRELDRTLAEIQSYARSHRLESFATVFERSRAQLSSALPGGGVYHSDLTTQWQLSLIAQQLLAASQLGWVFGGMGSWNDVGPQDADDTEYQRLSEALFGLLNRTYVAVANTTVRTQMGPSPPRWWPPSWLRSK